MRALTKTTWVANTALVCALVGCVRETKVDSGKTSVADDSRAGKSDAEKTKTIAKDPKMTDTATQTLVISKTSEASVRVKLGTVQFDAANRPTLSTEGSGPDVEKLKQDWQEISSKKELDWVKTVPEEVDGEMVKKIVNEPTKPGDPTYIYALFDELSRKYGYTVGIVE